MPPATAPPEAAAPSDALAPGDDAGEAPQPAPAPEGDPAAAPAAAEEAAESDATETAEKPAPEGEPEAPSAELGEASQGAASQGPASESEEAPARGGDFYGPAEADAGQDDTFGENTNLGDAPSLRLYGFADTTFTGLLMDEDNEWRDTYFPHSTFMVGNLNVYLDGALGNGWRALAEVRFTYLPTGAETWDANAQYVQTNTNVEDPANFGRPVHWGGILIQRAWLEYAPKDYFAVRAGHWLTPYSVWIVDHGSPTVIGVQRPLVLVRALFPESQTGVQVHGRTFFGAHTLGYHLTLSNGRGPADTYKDLDGNKAVGARLYWHWDFGKASLNLGSSAYAGRYTQHVKEATLNGNDIDITTTPTESFDEQSLAFDVRFDLSGLLFQSEVVMNQSAFREGARRLAVVPGPPRYEADWRRLGAYALLGYRTRFLGTMPYVVAQYHNFAGDQMLPETLGVSTGLNIRPQPNVVLKLEYVRATTPEPGSTGLGNEDFQLLQAQAAWAF